jgi:hypothetical protein
LKPINQYRGKENLEPNHTGVEGEREGGGETNIVIDCTGNGRVGRSPREVRVDTNTKQLLELRGEKRQSRDTRNDKRGWRDR